MDAFEYRGGELHAEGVSAHALATEFGTPLYVYSKGTLLDHYGKLASAFEEFDPVICYSVKANSNLAVLRTLREAGCGFDIVSGGELFRALRAGADAGKVVYAGVGKTDRELDEAVSAGIRLFTVESLPELEAISARAEALGKQVSVALRTNPDVDAHTHAHITTSTAEVKFGLDIGTVRRTLSEPGRFPGVRLDGLHLHIGSQIVETEPYRLALERVVPIMKELRSGSVPLSHLDIGGGFGINYRGSEAQPAEAFAKTIAPLVKESGAKLVLEPGRFIVGNAGILLARVTYVKRTPKRRFVIVDAAMNDLIRPALYGSVHAIWPVKAFGPPPARGGEPDPTSQLSPADVVGPICESGDFLGKDVELPEVERGDLIAVFSAGAYGFTMSSNYNSRPRAAEVMVDGDA
ncbi:MAG: diaminopimelate decarboxylase, partial [Planctomycetota bacterium]